MTTIGENRRFLNEQLVLGKRIQTDPNYIGYVNLEMAQSAALDNKGSELISQDQFGTWHVHEVFEKDRFFNKLNPLSHLDKEKLVLDPHFLQRNRLTQVQFSFADDRKVDPLPLHIHSMDWKQKLVAGNSVVLKNLLAQASDTISHPIKSAANFAEGIFSSTLETIKNPSKVYGRVSEAWERDKLEGVIEGIKVVGALGITTSLIAGAAATTVGLLTRGGSIAIGARLTSLSRSGASLAARQALLPHAVTLAKVGQVAGQVGVVAGTIGKYAGYTVMGATGLSFVKNEIDLARVENSQEMRHEINQLTQDATIITRTALMTAISAGLKKVAEKVKDLYTEPRQFKSISTRANRAMDEFINFHSKQLADKITKAFPQFRPGVWDRLSNSQKLDILNQISEMMGEQMGFKPASIQFEDSGGYGAYSPASHSIKINPAYLDDLFETGNTLAHEQFHAMQQVVVNIYNQSGPEALNTLFKEHSASWADNDTSYLSGDWEVNPEMYLGDKLVIDAQSMGYVFPKHNSYFDYRYQPLEATAFQMGDAFSSTYQGLISQQTVSSMVTQTPLPVAQ